ncbi:MAG: hypothetical protein M3680_22860 [Myxococcota bacterium]|nr:hypothetical protein [Myxococcota bacterium]
MPIEIPSLSADAARVLVSAHTVHIELAMTQPDGSFAPRAHLAVPAGLAAELAVLLARAVQECARVREASLVATSPERPHGVTT